MKRILSILTCMLIAPWAGAQTSAPTQQSVVHVATALNHLTVLEFHEPVTMAAVGSSDFQIERQADKVFIKPTKPNAATDLLVWTQSSRFAYELETTAEVKNMNFTVDAAIPVRQPIPASSADQIADKIVTRAFLSAIEIKNKQRKSQDNLNVQIDEVFRTRSTVYIHYRIKNNSDAIYHPGSPSVFELRPEWPSTLDSLMHTQLDARDIKRLGTADLTALITARTETDSEDLQPGGALQGVIALRQHLTTPSVLQVEFAGELKATFVL
jgi:hypothetical protein